MKIDKSQTGGANASHKQGMKEKYSDDVGLDAGGSFPAGSAVGSGTERGFQARPSSQYSPQNSKPGVCSEYTLDVSYGGQTKFPDEP